MAYRGINKVILVGNLGSDPENRMSQAGAAITNLSIATSETWKDKSTGQQQERTEWHRVVFFNRLAEVAAEYLRNTDPTEARPDARPAHKIHLVLDNVRSAYNVGSLFRTADTAHVAEVVTCGFTPHPPHPKLAKTGFSALESVATRHFDTTLAACPSKSPWSAPKRVLSVEQTSLGTPGLECTFGKYNFTKFTSCEIVSCQSNNHDILHIFNCFLGFLNLQI